MKKLNRKGFTLVELLAVIVILAIVVGVSIPAINSIINGSKNSALGVAVESAVDYLQDQFDIYNIDGTAASSTIVTLINAGTDGTTLDATNTDPETAANAAKIIKEMGFDTANVSKVLVRVNQNRQTATAEICVQVLEVPTSSDYFTTSYFDILEENTEKARPTKDAKYQSGTGCPTPDHLKQTN